MPTVIVKRPRYMVRVGSADFFLAKSGEKNIIDSVLKFTGPELLTLNRVVVSLCYGKNTEDHPQRRHVACEPRRGRNAHLVRASVRIHDRKPDVSQIFGQQVRTCTIVYKNRSDLQSVPKVRQQRVA